MSLSFHWFLPTSGDSRSIVGGGHGADLRVSAADRPATTVAGVAIPDATICAVARAALSNRDQSPSPM